MLPRKVAFYGVALRPKPKPPAPFHGSITFYGQVRCEATVRDLACSVRDLAPGPTPESHLPQAAVTGAYPLDMSQYANLFRSTRIPGTEVGHLAYPLRLLYGHALVGACASARATGTCASRVALITPFRWTTST